MWGDEGVVGVSRLYDAIHAALCERGLTRGPPVAIEPHLTLMYDTVFAAERVIPAVTWTVRDFALLASHQGHGRHQELGRWRLAG